MIYGPAVTAFAIGAFLVVIWVCLLLYASARHHGIGKGFRESIGLFVGALVIMAVMAIALFTSYWAADRFKLTDADRKVLYNVVALGLVFIAWSTWSIFKTRRRYRRFKER